MIDKKDIKKLLILMFRAPVGVIILAYFFAIIFTPFAHWFLRFINWYWDLF